MRVISKSRLKEFWERPGHEDSKTSLLAWYNVVSSSDLAWQDFSDVKATYSTASLVGDCVVFNIGGNKYRLITRIRYAKHRVYVLKVMTHREYDVLSWKEECGCFSPDPNLEIKDKDKGKSTRRQKVHRTTAPGKTKAGFQPVITDRKGKDRKR